MCKKNVSYFIFKCNGVKCTIVSTESTSKWYECGAWVNPSSYFLPLFNNSAIGQWGGGDCSSWSMWRESGGFYLAWERGGGDGGEWEELRELLADFIENAESIKWTSVNWVPSKSLSLSVGFTCSVFLQRISISSQHLEYTKRVRIYANPTRESTTFVKLKRRNVSFLCETNISDPSNRHLTR